MRRLPARWATEVWAVLTSAWVAVAVVLAIIAVAIAGSMLPQTSATSAYALNQWQYEHPWVSAVAGPLGLFQAFSSWTFIVILVVLAVNLVACTVDRTARRSKTALGGARFNLAFAGSLVLHAGILVLLVGGAVTAGYRFDGTAVATEGQTLDLGRGDFVRETLGPLSDESAAPQLLVTLDRFRPAYDHGVPVALDSDVTLVGEGVERRQVIVAVNKPVEVGGIRITQAGHGYSPAVAVVSSTGVVLVDAFVALESQRGPDGDTFSDRVGVPGLDGELELSVYPDLVFEGGRPLSDSVLPRNPALQVKLIGPDGGVEAEGLARLGEEATVAGYNVIFRDLRYWAAFRVVRDPGRWVVNSAFVVCLVGLLLRYAPGYVRRPRGARREEPV